MPPLVPNLAYDLARPSAPVGSVATRRPVGTVASFAAHAHIFRQGDAHRGLHEVRKGTVVVYRLLADGRRQVQNFATAGDLIGVEPGETYDTSAEALTPVETNFITRSLFDRAMREDAGFRQSVFAFVHAMLAQAREQAVLLGRKSAMERTASFLIGLEARYGAGEDGLVPIPMCRCDIADHLGLTLETVSRMLNRLKQNGVIDLPRPNAFAVKRRGELEALAGE